MSHTHIVVASDQMPVWIGVVRIDNGSNSLWIHVPVLPFAKRVGVYTIVYARSAKPTRSSHPTKCHLGCDLGQKPRLILLGRRPYCHSTSV